MKVKKRSFKPFKSGSRINTVEKTYHKKEEVTVKATICNSCGAKFYAPDTLQTLEQLA